MAHRTQIGRGAAALLLLIAAGCSGRATPEPANEGTAEVESSIGMVPGYPGYPGYPGGGADAGAGGDEDPTRGPLPDPCPDDKTIVCDEVGCACGDAPAEPASCDAQVDCQGDGDCGDGQCCHRGFCIGKTEGCACGDQAVTRSSSSGPGCDGLGYFVDDLEEQAQYMCSTSAPMFGNMCGPLGMCVGTAAIGAVSTRCYEPEPPQMIGGQSATVCFHCDFDAPADAPPNNDAECDELQIKISNKKAEINTKSLEIRYLQDGINKLNAAITSVTAFLASLQDAESKLLTGHFGENVFLKTSGQTTKLVTDIYGGAKMVTTVQKVGCLGQRAFCRTNLIGRVPHYSWKNVVISKRAWGEVYEPAAAWGVAKLAGQAACPDPAPDDSWFSWWPGYSSGQWFIGCFTKDAAVQEIGEKRLNAMNNKRELEQRRDAMMAERDQALQDLGKLRVELEALEKEHREKCTCQRP